MLSNSRSKKSSDQDLKDAWEYLPRLFKCMDLDDSGTLDHNEILGFLRRFAAVKQIEVNPCRCMALIQQSDDNRDRVLNVNEFSTFMTLIAEEACVSIFELTYFMMQCTGEKLDDATLQMEKRAAKKSMLDRLLRTLHDEELEHSK